MAHSVVIVYSTNSMEVTIRTKCSSISNLYDVCARGQIFRAGN